MIKHFSLQAGIPEPMHIVKAMIRSHVQRIRLVPGTNLATETLAVRLDKSDIDDFFNNHNAKNLIAFFGVDHIDNTTTVILMGLDDNDNIIKEGNSYLAVERWTRKSLSIQDIINNPTRLDTEVFP